MTIEEARKRAEAAEKRKKREYYLAHREHLLQGMREYGKRNRAVRTIKERECRQAKPLKYAETQLRYWQRKLEETGDRQAGYNVTYWAKKVKTLKGEEQ